MRSGYRRQEQGEDKNPFLADPDTPLYRNHTKKPKSEIPGFRYPGLSRRKRSSGEGHTALHNLGSQSSPGRTGCSLGQRSPRHSCRRSEYRCRSRAHCTCCGCNARRRGRCSSPAHRSCTACRCTPEGRRGGGGPNLRSPMSVDSGQPSTNSPTKPSQPKATHMNTLYKIFRGRLFEPLGITREDFAM